MTIFFTFTQDLQEQLPLQSSPEKLRALSQQQLCALPRRVSYLGGPHCSSRKLQLIFICKALFTQYFCTQYCDKKILQNLTFLATDFYWTTKVSSCKNLVYLVLLFYKSLPWPIDIYGPKNYFLSQYLLIPILWAKMSRVNKALGCDT